MQRLGIKDAVGRIVLAGRLAARSDRSKLEGEIVRIPKGSPVLLDFADVEILTASYFAEGIWDLFWEGARAKEGDLYPLLYRVSLEVRDEIRIALLARSKAAAFASGNVKSPQVEFFNLDDTAEQTLSLVEDHGETSAGKLYQYDPSIGQTAWNNRLSGLHSDRILRRRREGRIYFYSLPWRT